MTYRLTWTDQQGQHSQDFGSRVAMSRQLVIVRSFYGVRNIRAYRIYSSGDVDEL